MRSLSYLTTLLKGALVSLPVLLAGCASVPEALRDAPAQSPAPLQVRTSPEQYAGVRVRWGGSIVAVKNGPAQSEVEVAARPLGSEARPLMSQPSVGRFLVRINDFVDPVDYAPGRELTVVGTIEGVEPRALGGYQYSYPVVRASAYYLWPPRLPPAPDPYFYAPFYDPFYNPWYLYGPYPPPPQYLPPPQYPPPGGPKERR